jgi:hypothetical protein
MRNPFDGIARSSVSARLTARRPPPRPARPGQTLHGRQNGRQGPRKARGALPRTPATSRGTGGPRSGAGRWVVGLVRVAVPDPPMDGAEGKHGTPGGAKDAPYGRTATRRPTAVPGTPGEPALGQSPPPTGGTNPAQARTMLRTQPGRALLGTVVKGGRQRHLFWGGSWLRGGPSRARAFSGAAGRSRPCPAVRPGPCWAIGGCRRRACAVRVRCRARRSSAAGPAGAARRPSRPGAVGGRRARQVRERQSVRGRAGVAVWSRGPSCRGGAHHLGQNGAPP